MDEQPNPSAPHGKPRRRLQYNLRTAILLMTLACVTASWLGWVRYKARLDAQEMHPDWWHTPRDPYERERIFREMNPEAFTKLPPLPPPPKRPPTPDW